MSKSSPQELKKLRSRARQEEAKAEQDKAREKKLSAHETMRSRKFVVTVTWFIAIAFAVTSFGLLVGFGMDAITKKDQNIHGQTAEHMQEDEQAKIVRAENIKRFKDMIQKEPDNTIHYNNLASEYFQAGMEEDAIDTFKKSIEIDPTDTFAMRGLAEIYVNQKEYQKARDILHNAIETEQDPLNRHPFYMMLSLVDREDGKLGDAITNIEKAIEIDAGNPHYYLLLSQIYLETGNKVKAMETVENGLVVAKAMRDQQGELLLEYQKMHIEKPPAPEDSAAPETTIPAPQEGAPSETVETAPHDGESPVLPHEGFIDGQEPPHAVPPVDGTTAPAPQDGAIREETPAAPSIPALPPTEGHVSPPQAAPQPAPPTETQEADIPIPQLP